MSSIKVNTDKVVGTADKLNSINNSIRDSFGSVQSAIRTLDNSWDGSAASNAISKFNSIKSNYQDARYSVVSNYVNFLLQQVGQGYDQTEEANKSLADSFK